MWGKVTLPAEFIQNAHNLELKWQEVTCTKGKGVHKGVHPVFTTTTTTSGVGPL